MNQPAGIPDQRYAEGSVWHQRAQPTVHAFRYRLWFALLDVERIESAFSGSRLWSISGPGLVGFRRSDYLCPQTPDLGQAVRDRVESELGRRPAGPIRMLTHLRQWGSCFNPVTFYFCERPVGGLDAIVAEVNNTPWDQRHAYVLDALDQPGPDYRFDFDKAFHVSPFLPMDMAYQWRIDYRPDRLAVHMKVMRGPSEWFSVGMRLNVRALTRRAMRRLPLRFPLMGAKVVVAIYWQAFRLWLKRIPFHPHPDSGSSHEKRLQASENDGKY